MTDDTPIPSERKSEVYDLIAWIVADAGDPEWLHPYDAASAFYAIAHYFPKAN